MKTLDDYFSDWEGSVFGFGYGTGEEYTVPALKEFMSLLVEKRSYDYINIEKHFGKLAGWLLINALCKADILEYGTSPRYGWLSDKGERLRSFLETKTIGELYKLTSRTEDYTPCYPDVCNCGDDEGKHCNNPFWTRNWKQLT